MSTCPPENPSTGIDDILDSVSGLSLAQRQDLRERLIAREDNIAVIFHLAGEQYGLFPQIVAEVLAQAGLGNPLTTEQRKLIHDNWHNLMDRLREEHERGQS